MLGYKLYWGDIHNHNELGYAQGSLERSYEIARSHLDFYAFTPHGLHADGGAPEGYPVVVENWERIRAAAAAHDAPGAFSCFLGYEWHSSRWGHVHVIHLEDHHPMHCARSLAELQEHFRGREVILVPHHIAYEHGVDWELFDEELSPLVEIFSEHGSSEADFGSHPLLGHSSGPGPARYTAQHGLALGRKFGFSAGTDNHDGYPGGYGLGLTGVWAGENTRAAIFSAFRQRRTFAATGDRIALEFRAGEAPMGSVVAAAQARSLAFGVQGWDFLKEVELLRDNLPVLVQRPEYGGGPAGETLYRLRLEWGWGPMKGYQLYDWEGEFHLEGGRLEQAVPCFVSDPFDEHRRKRILALNESGCRWQSHTSRGAIFTTRNGLPACAANDALCLEVRGDERTQVAVHFRCRSRTSLLATPGDWSITPRSATQKRTFSLGELARGRQGFGMGPVPTWVVVHRAVPPPCYRLEGEYDQELGAPACYYLRVTQENGQMAWSSPIWVE